MPCVTGLPRLVRTLWTHRARVSATVQRLSFALAPLASAALFLLHTLIAVNYSSLCSIDIAVRQRGSMLSFSWFLDCVVLRYRMPRSILQLHRRRIPDPQCHTP